MRKSIAVILMLCVALVTVIGGGNNESDSSGQELVIWSFNVSQEALDVLDKTVFAEYEAQNPGITINWQNIPYAGYREKLLTAAAGSVLPDVFIDGFNMSGSYVGSGIVTDITENLEEWDLWNSFDPSVQNLVSYEGKLYGFPFRLKVYPLIINTRLFKEAGLDPDNTPLETWSQVMDAAKKLLKVENGVVVQEGMASFYDKSSIARIFDILVQQDGGQFIDEHGNPAFNDQHGLNAMNYCIELYSVKQPEGTSPVDTSVSRSYLQGKAAMTLMESYDVIELGLQSGNEDILYNTKVLPPMKSDNPDGKQVLMFDGDMAYIASTSDKKDLALDFLKFFYEPENFIQYLEANKCVPVYESEYNEQIFDKYPIYRDLFEMQKYGGVLANTAVYRVARDYLSDEIEAVLIGGNDPQAALDTAEAMWLREIEDMS